MRGVLCIGLGLLLACVYAHEESADTVLSDSYQVEPPSNAFFFETFQDEDWSSRWIVSEAEDYEGKWSVGRGELDWGLEGDTGLVLESPAKKHAISSLITESVSYKEGIVVQYEVRLHKRLDCGGAYLKLIRQQDDFAPQSFQSSTDYVIMFGPDKCGGTNKVHFIFKHKNPISGKYEEKHLENPPKIKADQLTHLYTLVIRPDNTYEIFIDKKSEKKGSLFTDFEPSVNPPKLIDDPTDKKPSDWEDEEYVPDPNAQKPDDWDEDAPKMIPDPSAIKPSDWLDDAPAMIPDPKAEKPDDWDDELDGDWEAPLVENPDCIKSGCGEWNRPMIKNPEYKGKWEVPMIKNDKYKGVWKARQIENPEYFEDTEPFKMSPIGAIGFELWTMQDQIQFDNIYIGSSARSAFEFADRTWKPKEKIEKAHEAETAKNSLSSVSLFCDCKLTFAVRS
jgi:calnexin